MCVYIYIYTLPRLFAKLMQQSYEKPSFLFQNLANTAAYWLAACSQVYCLDLEIKKNL